MVRAFGRIRLAAAAATLLVATACKDSQGPKPNALLDPLPGLATLAVSTSTTGSNLDPAGYTVTLDGGSSRAIGINASVTFTGLTPGSHSVVLSGVAGNCTVSGGTSRTVSVTAGSTASTSYSVSCAPTGPTTGSLSVTTATSGASGDLDPDGYTVTLDGATSRAIGENGTTTFSGRAEGR